MITMTIHSQTWFDNLKQRAATFKQSVPVVMTDEARLYALEMADQTPPTNPTKLKGKDGKKLSNMTVGTNSARRDVLRAMTPASPDWPDSPLSQVLARSPRLRKYILEGDVEKFTKFIKHLGKFSNWRVETFSPDLHLKAKGSRGRVHTTKRIFIIGAQQLAAYWKYLSKTLNHVGRLKAGWLPAIEKLGGKITERWITRHRAGANGRIEMQLEGSLPRIEIANSALGVGQLEQRANWVFMRRAKAIKNRMRQALKNLAAIGRGGNLMILKNPDAINPMDAARAAIYNSDDH